MKYFLLEDDPPNKTAFCPKYELNNFVTAKFALPFFAGSLTLTK